MKPPPFRYHAPTRLEEVLELLVRYGGDARPLAGGQSLVPALNFRLSQPGALIDLNRVSGLDHLEESADGSLRVGAMVRQRRLERHPLVQQQWPLIVEVLHHVAHPQIRNRGTVGGSLAHADPAAELPALALALDMTLTVQSPRGKRTLPAGQFFTGMFATAMAPDELLVEMQIPPLSPQAGWGFREVARRHGDYALVGAVAVLEVDAQHICRRARLALFSVGDGPVRAQKAEALLTGQAVSEQLIDQAAHLAAAEDIDPPGDIHASAAFRRFLARNIVADVLRQALKNRVKQT